MKGVGVLGRGSGRGGGKKRGGLSEPRKDAEGEGKTEVTRP